MTNPMHITEATALETRYIAMLTGKHTAKEWHDMGVALDDAAKRLLCVDLEHRKALLIEKADDCHEQSKRVATGSHELYPTHA